MPDSLSFFQRAARPEMVAGASGYFSAPSDSLDPNLFNGLLLKSGIRDHICNAFFGWMKLNSIILFRPWLRMWLAGSGISYQWAASRGNGDLDVLLGVNLRKFAEDNPEFGGTSPEELSATLNSALKRDLWPKTAQTAFGSQVYEVTYYLNPGVQEDISAINPYAAYEIYPGDRWVIRPPQLPADPKTIYPSDWFDRAGYDTRNAAELTSHYNRLMDRLSSAREGSPEWHSAGAGLHYLVASASALFDELHTGRHAAFGPGGKGYGDWANFRWQHAKSTGTVQALHQIMTVGAEARADEETRLYGAPIDPADVALRRAAAAHRQNPLAR